MICFTSGSVILDPVRIPQGEDQVGELVPLEFGDKLLVLLVGELAGVVFKNSLSSLPHWVCRRARSWRYYL